MLCESPVRTVEEAQVVGHAHLGKLSNLTTTKLPMHTLP
jgi:hypothetical protein